MGGLAVDLVFPRVLVSPVSYHSKKYYVLGKVMLKGAFTLDRPMTVIEAVARAQGLETGILNFSNKPISPFI